MVAGLSAKVLKLNEGRQYEFQVAAENLAGCGSFSEISNAILCREPVYEPGPPLSLKVIDTTNNSVKLKWSRPDHDGGLDITGYLVEMKGLDSESWSKSSPHKGVAITSFTADALDTNTKYEFRVSAINDAGTGPSVVLSGSVQPCDVLEVPAVPFNAEMRKSITIKAGHPLRLLYF